MIRHLVTALRGAGIDPDWRDVADALWLACARGPSTGGAWPMAASTTADVPASATDEIDHSRAQAGTDALPRGGPPPGGSTHRPTLSRLTEVTGTPLDYHPSAQQALPTRAEIGRALRPFTRTRPSRTESVLDVDATVARWCETRVLEPVQVPVREGWFHEVVLVVDDSPTMVVWHEAVAALTDLLRYHHAFRTVTTWTVVGDQHSLSLKSGAALPSVSADRRQIVFVVTDGVGPAWTGTPIWSAVQAWGQRVPVALLQMLPARLWPASALGDTDVSITSPGRGLPNSLLSVRPPWWWEGERLPGQATPVVTLESDRLARWSRLVMAQNDTPIGGVITDPLPPPRPRSAPWSSEQAAAQVSIFRATMSDPAAQLATLLSAVEVTLPIARLLADNLFGCAGAEHVAEVFVGGLLRPDGERAYDFLPGIREVLQESLTADDTIAVWRTVGPYLEATTGYRVPFATLINEPAAGDDDSTLAGIVRDLVDRLGLTVPESVVNLSAPADVTIAITTQSAAEALAVRGVMTGVTTVGEYWVGELPSTEHDLPHHVVLAVIDGRTVESAARLLSSFPTLRLVISVGLTAGRRDLRPGDVVVALNGITNLDSGASTTSVPSADLVHAIDQLRAAQGTSWGDDSAPPPTAHFGQVGAQSRVLTSRRELESLLEATNVLAVGQHDDVEHALYRTVGMLVLRAIVDDDRPGHAAGNAARYTRALLAHHVPFGPRAAISPNPFRDGATGRPVTDPAMFYGRTELIDAIETHFVESQAFEAVALLGQNRAGKSSVGFQLSRRLREGGRFLVLDVGLAGLGLYEHERDSGRRLLWSILSAARELVTQRNEDGAERIEFLPSDFGWEQFLQSRTPITDFQKVWTQFRAAADASADWLDRPFVLIMDNFEIVTNRLDDGSLDPVYVRALRQCHLMVVGHDAIRPVFETHLATFGLISLFRIGLLEREHAVALMDEPIRLDGESRYRDRAHDLVLELTGGSPFYLQRFCYELVEHLNRAKRRFITETDVEVIRARLVSECTESDFYGIENNGDPEAVRAVLTTLARGPATQDEVLGRCAVPDAVPLLETLVHRDVVSLEAGKYRIVVGLYRDWLRARSISGTSTDPAR